MKLKDDGGAPASYSQQQNKDFLLMDNSNVDYEQMKNQYPLRANKDDNSSSPDPLGKISANDISAFNDDSMMDGN